MVRLSPSDETVGEGVMISQDMILSSAQIVCDLEPLHGVRLDGKHTTPARLRPLSFNPKFAGLSSPISRRSN
jgi:hypothetical protein